MPSPRTLVATLMIAALPAVASASSPDAWEAFAKDVAQKCEAATKDTFRRSTVAVDPTGSETFGLAIVHGRLKAAKKRGAVICVVDKKSGKVEIGSELGADQIRVNGPKPDANADGKAKPADASKAKTDAADDDQE